MAYWPCPFVLCTCRKSHDFDRLCRWGERPLSLTASLTAHCKEALDTSYAIVAVQRFSKLSVSASRCLRPLAAESQVTATSVLRDVAAPNIHPERYRQPHTLCRLHTVPSSSRLTITIVILQLE